MLGIKPAWPIAQSHILSSLGVPSCFHIEIQKCLASSLVPLFDLDNSGDMPHNILHSGLTEQSSPKLSQTC